MEYPRIRCMLVCLLLFGLINTGYSKPSPSPSEGDYVDDADGVYSDMQNDDNDYDQVYDDNAQDPSNNEAVIPGQEVEEPMTYFEVPEINQTAKSGEDVILRCDAKNLPVDPVTIWYNGTTVLVQGTFTINSRVKILEKNAIKIVNAQPTDSSNYSCQIAPSTSRLNINLLVLSEPHIVISSHDRLYTNRSITYTQGTRVEFECKAFYTKNPYKIIWSMNGNRVRKDKVSNGKVLINEVHADDAGTYQCLADDDSNRPLHATITVNVQYPPKVSTHRHHVNAQEGEVAELYCNYKADPIATVHWKKNGELIPFTAVDKYRIEEMHLDKGLSRTILFVQNVARQDLGEYECEIQNSLGISQKKIHLQYEPETPQFEKIVQNGKVISLEWLVRSRQPLVDAIVDYKINSTHQWMKQPITSSKKHDEHTGVWKLTHDLELAPGIWHFKIRTQNSEGWSEFSSQYDLVVPEATTDNDNSRPNDIIYAADVTGQSPNSATQFTLVPFILSSCLLQSIRLVPFFRIL